MEALPIGQIGVPITFGDLQNFHTEILTFEVVGFSGMYHAIPQEASLRKVHGRAQLT
jgi:hypothetical protein